MDQIQKPKLWVYTEFFFPDETATSFIMTKICNKLCQKYNVFVICGDTVIQKPTSQDTEVLNPLVNVKRIKTLGVNRSNSLLRALNFITISLVFFLHLLFKTKRKEKIFTVTNPATFLIFAAIGKTIKKNNLTLLVHDVFPENTIPGNILKSEKSILYKILLPIFNRSYASADKLIVLGRDMKEVLKSKIKKYNSKPNIVVIENWSESDSVYPTTYQNDKIVFQFAGNLGRVQGLMNLLETIAKVKNDLLEFHFIGEGALKNAMISFVSQHGMSNVVFKEAFKREQQIDVLNSCDISIVTLSSGMFGLGVPSKSYNILSAGKPILFIGDKNSEIDLMIADNNIGFSFDKTEDLIGFFNNLSFVDKSKLKEMGSRSRSLAETIYSRDHILNKYEREI